MSQKCQLNAELLLIFVEERITDKKENKIFLIDKEIQKEGSCKVIYVERTKCLRISSYIM
jgi:hypothetical protein